MLDDSKAASARITGETKADIFCDKVESQAVFVNEDDKTGIPAECFESHGAGTGKKIENICSLDGFAKNTEQGFPGLIRGRSDTLVMRRRGKEFSTFCYAADNSQKFTQPGGIPEQSLRLELFDPALLPAQFQEEGKDQPLSQIE